MISDLFPIGRWHSMPSGLRTRAWRSSGSVVAIKEPRAVDRMRRNEHRFLMTGGCIRRSSCERLAI